MPLFPSTDYKTIAAFNGVNVSVCSNGTTIDEEWFQGPLMLSGDLAELGGETVNPCTSNVDTLGRAERLTIIGGQNVGRGIDGIVCFGALVF